MKTFVRLLLIVSIANLLSGCSKSNDAAPKNLLIAQFPLLSDGKDATGYNEPMTLTMAPFQNGGTYSNGIYEYDSAIVTSSGCIIPNPKASVVLSPTLRYFNFKSFSISMDFLVSENKTQPVWVIGTCARWLGFYLYDDGTVALLYDDSSFLTTEKKYSLNEWHNAKITFDGTTVKIYLDNTLAGYLKLSGGDSGLNAFAACGKGDTQIGTSNFANGGILNGYVKNLEVFSSQ